MTLDFSRLLLWSTRGLLPAETRGSGNDNVAAELDIGVGAGFTDVCWFDLVADVVVAGVVGTDVGVNDDADRYFEMRAPQVPFGPSSAPKFP